MPSWRRLPTQKPQFPGHPLFDRFGLLSTQSENAPRRRKIFGGLLRVSWVDAGGVRGCGWGFDGDGRDDGVDAGVECLLGLGLIWRI